MRPAVISLILVLAIPSPPGLRALDKKDWAAIKRDAAGRMDPAVDEAVDVLEARGVLEYQRFWDLYIHGSNDLKPVKAGDRYLASLYDLVGWEGSDEAHAALATLVASGVQRTTLSEAQPRPGELADLEGMREISRFLGHFELRMDEIFGGGSPGSIVQALRVDNGGGGQVAHPPTSAIRLVPEVDVQVQELRNGLWKLHKDWPALHARYLAAVKARFDPILRGYRIYLFWILRKQKTMEATASDYAEVYREGMESLREARSWLLRDMQGARETSPR